jgi:hypothetical protein
MSVYLPPNFGKPAGPLLAEPRRIVPPPLLDWFFFDVMAIVVARVAKRLMIRRIAAQGVVNFARRIAERHNVINEARRHGQPS